jgi:putative glutamine amidotransferase
VSRPAIGICAAVEQARFGAWDQPATLLPLGYTNAVQDAGGVALLLPTTRRRRTLPSCSTGSTG